MELYKGNDFNGERYWEIIEAGAEGLSIEEFNQRSAHPLEGEELEIFQWAHTAEKLDMVEGAHGETDAPLFLTDIYLQELEERLKAPDELPPRKAKEGSQGPLFLSLMEREGKETPE